jgi:hypothetical protein
MLKVLLKVCSNACVYLPENMNLLHLHEKSARKKVEICKEKTKIDTTKPRVKTHNKYWHNSFLEEYTQLAVTFVHPH